MRKVRIIFIFFIISGILFNPALFAQGQVENEGRVLTLLDCYNLTLKQSETLGISVQRIKEAESHFLQAIGTIMPQVSFASADNFYNIHTTSANTYTRGFVFQQVLFSGFKEFAAMRASGYEKKQRTKEVERAEQLLFGDVSDSFYLLLEQIKDLKALEATRQSLLERIQELDKRISIGRSRKSELATVMVEFYGVEAEIITAKNQRDVAKELLEFLTGVAIKDIIESEDVPGSVKPIDYYQRLAVMRADIEAAEKAVGLARENITVARSGFLPSVNVESQYLTNNSTALPPSKLATTLSVNIPIFEGTTVLGNVRQAQAQARESELQLELTRRQSQTDVLQAYTNMQYSLISKEAHAKALNSAVRNYYLQKKDYEYNLVNNLDVLTAIRLLEDSRRDFIHAANETKRLYWQLCVAAGENIGEVLK